MGPCTVHVFSLRVLYLNVHVHKLDCPTSHYIVFIFCLCFIRLSQARDFVQSHGLISAGLKLLGYCSKVKVYYLLVPLPPFIQAPPTYRSIVNT